MNRLLPIILTFVVAAIGSACVGDDGKSTPTAVAASQPSGTAAEPTAAVTTETSIQIVDEVVSAVTRKDVATLRQLIELVKLPCVTGNQVGPTASLKCAEGEPAGTLIDVLPAARDEGFYVCAEAVEDELRRVLAPGFRLAMVYRTTEADGGGPLSPVQGRHVRNRVLQPLRRTGNQVHCGREAHPRAVREGHGRFHPTGSNPGRLAEVTR